MVEIEIDVELPEETWQEAMVQFEQALANYKRMMTPIIHNRIWSEVRSRVIESHYGRACKLVPPARKNLGALPVEPGPLRARFEFEDFREAALFRSKFGREE